MPGFTVLAVPQFFDAGHSFVSVTAKTLLAAELVMGDLDSTDAMRQGNRSIFQFWTPSATTKRSSNYVRDPACPCAGWILLL